MAADHIEQWLENLPLDEPVDIDGETAILKLKPNGAELGIFLAPMYTDVMLVDALRSSFQVALDFNAGLSTEGEDLMLTQWLPYVGSWTEAAEALESILNQAGMLRAAMAYAGPGRQEKDVRRGEERVRKLFSGG
ncbi:hypothetical protein [Herbaspirillum sp. RV1423]|uniref:hypothetical protein n=1 Tax=Herbaspirillum sp. RV1423 TaxID=1443993 RepID=UPI0004B37653|nr:hypothetical protein [Herbaspirillum sp. RV1423]